MDNNDNENLSEEAATEIMIQAREVRPDFYNQVVEILAGELQQSAKDTAFEAIIMVRVLNASVVIRIDPSAYLDEIYTFPRGDDEAVFRKHVREASPEALDIAFSGSTKLQGELVDLMAAYLETNRATEYTVTPEMVEKNSLRL